MSDISIQCPMCGASLDNPDVKSCHACGVEFIGNVKPIVHGEIVTDDTSTVKKVEVVDEPVKPRVNTNASEEKEDSDFVFCCKGIIYITICAFLVASLRTLMDIVFAFILSVIIVVIIAYFVNKIF